MKEVQSLGDIRFGTLARAAEGLTQWRPLLLGFLTLLLTGITVWLGQLLAIKVSAIFALIMMVLAFVVMMAGFSGVGIMLMDKAKEQPVRSFAAAASAGLLCLPRFLLIGLVMTVVFIAYMIVAAIFYFLGKIPFIGGVIAFIAHPVLVLVFAAVLVAFIWVIGPLMAPALWSGLPVKAALGNVITIARKRLIEVVLMEVVLYVILTLICVLLFAGLVPATASLTSMGISIMADSNALMGMAMGMGGGGFNPASMLYAGGNSWGLVAGLGVLYCVVGALLTQVAIMGMNLIYLQARGNLNPEDAEGALNDFMGDMRKKAAEAKDLARQTAQDLSAKKNGNDNAAETPPAAAPAQGFQTPQEHSPAAYGASTAAAGFAAGSISSTQPSAADSAHLESMAREQAMAAEKARFEAEAQAARQRAEAEAAERAATERATAERAAQERAQAAEQAAREQAQAQAAAEEARRNAEAQAAQQAAAQAAEQARQREQAEAAERAAREQAQAQAAAEEARRNAEAQAAQQAAAQAAEQARLREQAEAAERAARERAQAAEQAARERAEAQAAAQAAEQARLREQAEAQARQQAEREAAEREAARVRAQAEAEAKAKLAAASPSCPSCHAQVTADDMFCGECGHRLK
ncbi:zinc ribbon domain-containing protein [Comamonas fluminis]|uniref:zinc ribbon domain-containing protein n=1 Tax=Comamonas fluminis TaxID=2796366 RepID=UPI001C45B337|nr:zinc ribbon domain-containing protein [Comamonas fluminis]